MSSTLKAKSKTRWGIVVLLLISITLVCAYDLFRIYAWINHDLNGAVSQADMQAQSDEASMFNALFFRPSFDTTPQDVIFGNNHYKIPRNYIVQADDWHLPYKKPLTIRVTYPGFKPFSKETLDCMTKAPAFRPKGCAPQDFRFMPVADVSDDEGFKNLSQVFRTLQPKQGPNGFELYEIGRADVEYPGEVYRKTANGHTLYFTCLGSYKLVEEHKENATECTTSSRLPNQNAVQYMILRWPAYTGDQLLEADEIDAGIRKLIDSFLINGEQP